MTLSRKVGETDTLYGSVTSSDIADALAAQGIEIDRRRIQLDEPLKQLGETMLAVKLQRDVVAQLRVAVVKDEA